jgi:hypothetical protein
MAARRVLAQRSVCRPPGRPRARRRCRYRRRAAPRSPARCAGMWHVAHHSTAATVSYGSRLTPLAASSHVPVDTWVSISASRDSVVTAWAASRASSMAASSSMDGLAPSSAHDAHVAITHAATSAAGSAWVAPDIAIVTCRPRSAWSWGSTQPMGRARIAAPFVALPGEPAAASPRRNRSIAAVVVGPRPRMAASCSARSARNAAGSPSPSRSAR